MSFNFNGTQANVTISGGITVSGGTSVPLSGNLNGAGDITLGTVGAGKKWRITSAWVSNSVGGAVNNITSVQVNGVTIVGAAVTGIAGMNSGNSNALTWNYESAVIATAGQVVKGNNSAAGLGAAGITYIEEVA